MTDREEVLKQCDYKSITPEQFLRECNAYGGIAEGMDSGLRSHYMDNSNPEFKRIIRKIEDLYSEFDAELELLVADALEAIGHESD